MQTPTGWLPLCPTHYGHYWRFTRHSSTDPNGFRDREQMEARTRNGFKEKWYAERGIPYESPKASGLFRVDMSKYGPRQRDAGEDSEADVNG